MAAKKLLSSQNFNQNEIQNAVVQNLASAPVSPVTGQFYYDTTTNKFMWRNNSAFIDLTARANHSGTQTASTISDFGTAVQASRLDQMAAPTADVSFNSRKLTNLADGTNAQDAATVAQLQTVLQGRSFKDAVRVATTASVAQSGLIVIDGVTLVSGDRILDKDNATAANRGIWVANAGAWTRATDADTSAKMVPSTSVQVQEGTANGDKQFTLTTNTPINLGVTPLAFAQTGAGTTFTNGTGINISGSVINVDTSVVARKYAVSIGDGTSTTIGVSHGLATLDVSVQIYEVSTGATVDCDIVRTSISNVNMIFVVPPTTNQYRVVVTG
jgi:hypothetical protein